jgi:glycosyltransferase involved in cell wall biosynthesis
VKTLHLTNSWHSASGGIGTFYKALFQAADRERHQMRLVVPAPADRVEEVGQFGRIYHVRSPEAPLNREYRFIYPSRFLHSQGPVRRILVDEAPDLIEVSEKYSMPYLAGLLRTRRMPGIRFRPTAIGVSHERMDENFAAYLSPHPAGRAFCEWYMKWLYFPMFDHHIAVSDHTAGELIQASRGHKVRRGIWVSPMGVDCDRFTPERRCARIRAEILAQTGGDDPNAVLLFYAGRLAREKNLELLAATMQSLDPRKFRLAVAGDGALLEWLRAQCGAMRNVALLGFVPDRDLLAAYYASADLFVHPNPREPFGIAPLEAMAAGLALVAPDSGGVTSYANTSNAWLTPPTAACFAAAILAAAADPAARAARARNARATAVSYRWEVAAARFLGVCREIHALTQGLRESASVPACAWSTPGDAFGREIVKQNT